MKNIFTLLLATVSFSAFAYDGGKLTITIPSSKNVQVYVDGRVYQDNSTTIVLNNIQAGNHSIAIYRNNPAGYSNNGNYGRNKQRDKRYQADVLYSSNIYVKPSYHVDIMVNRFGKALVDERVINGMYSDDDDWNQDDYGNDGHNGGYNNNYHQAVSDYDFNQLLQKIRNQWIGKMSAAREGINGNYFTTSQVQQILQIFSSENDRLELAKLSYKNVVDQQSFRQVYQLFSYQAQSELDKYIKEFRY